MRKILGAIFGSPKNTETIVSGAVGGIDKMFFTQQEKAEANAKLGDWYLKYLTATQPQNLARRLIAMVIVFIWALLIIVGVVARGIELWVMGLVTAEEGEQLFSEFIFSVLVEVVMNPFLMVMGFYFVAHVVRTYNNGKQK